MCWFIGFTYEDCSLLGKMSKTIMPRAIDDEYFYTMKEYSFYHAHLKISDLDKDTSQPYVSDRLIIWLVWEIYNKDYILSSIWILKPSEDYTELEIIALAYEKLGASFINILNGEFAISIFDIHKNIYLLYRDRWWVNNVYYRLYNGHLFYASEIKALILDTPICSKKSMIDHLIFQFGISPETIVQDVFTLKPGTYMSFSRNTGIKIHDFALYRYQEAYGNIIDTIEASIVRRIPVFQDRILLWLSGWPDSNIILYFLKKHFRGEIIAYSFMTRDNVEEINIAQKNSKNLGVTHVIINMDDYISQDSCWDIYNHEGLILLPNLNKILRSKYPEFNDIKVEFWWDGKEELILGNNHYPYKKIIASYNYFYGKGLCNTYNINQEFLNRQMFDYNLQMIDKITLRNGLERRLPFTDYELKRYYKYPDYRLEVESFLRDKGIWIIKWEFWYNLGFPTRYLWDRDILKYQKKLFTNLKVIV